MKKPDGSIDIIGSALQLGSGIIGLVNDFAPTPEERSENKKQRKIRIAIRRLKHKFKNIPVRDYVKVNFAEYDETQQEEITNYIKQLL